MSIKTVCKKKQKMLIEMYNEAPRVLGKLDIRYSSF